MSKYSLAEAVILQAIEDMCAEENMRPEALEFFLGDNFSSWARLAGMNGKDQKELLKLMNLPIKAKKKKMTSKRKALYASKSLATVSVCP